MTFGMESFDKYRKYTVMFFAYFIYIYIFIHTVHIFELFLKTSKIIEILLLLRDNIMMILMSCWLVESVLFKVGILFTKMYIQYIYQGLIDIEV